MRKLLIGIAVGMVLSAAPLYAFRMEKPPTFTEWNSNTFTALNNSLLQLFNITNGRYQLDRVTVDPDGSRACSVGEMVFYDTGTDQVCVCAVSSTKKWNCWNAT